MPLYTYKCNNCEEVFDKRQKMSDSRLTECIYCDGQIRRVINSVGIVFKGKGFYVTDNRGKKNGVSGNSATSKSDTTTAEKETKPAGSGDTTSSTSETVTTKKAEKAAD